MIKEMECLEKMDSTSNSKFESDDEFAGFKEIKRKRKMDVISKTRKEKKDHEQIKKKIQTFQWKEAKANQTMEVSAITCGTSQKTTVVKIPMKTITKNRKNLENNEYL